MTRSTLAVAAVAASPLFLLGGGTAGTSAAVDITGIGSPRPIFSRWRETDIEQIPDLAITGVEIFRGHSIQAQALKSLERTWEGARRLASLEKTLRDFVALPEDWDDLGGIPASLEAAQMSLDFVEGFGGNHTFPSRAYSTPRGEVGLVWDEGDGYADVVFSEDGKVSYFVRAEDGSETLSEEAIEATALPEEFWTLLRSI